MSTAAQKLAIAQTFTNTERQTLRIWFDLDQAGHDVDADNLLQAGLILEHFQSRLDDVPSNRSVDDLDMLMQLEQQFQNAVDLANGILKGTTKAGSIPMPIVTVTRS